MLPKALEPLKDLAYNVWWAWDNDAQDIFVRIDPDAWEKSHHNPVKTLSTVSKERFNELAKDDAFLASMERVNSRFHDYISAKGWFTEHYKKKALSVAYFSLEFGLTESLPIYSGGLGILAGDHLKAASDLALPLVGVGLLYRCGYFSQSLNREGWQVETYNENDWSMLPVTKVLDAHGNPLAVSVEFPDGNVVANIWRVDVGRVPLYLLDTNIPENSQAMREITGQLYAGDRELRIRQELLLGVGGMRALKAMGIEPTVCHMNEGHAAFLAIERICQAMEAGHLNFDEASEATAAGNVFTTHTPVPAGNDEFAPDLLLRYLRPWQGRVQLDDRAFLGLGRRDINNNAELFCMTVLAIKLSAYRNGVSRLHGHVSQGMWQPLYKDVPVDDVPITSVTNGVHLRTWISRDMAVLYDRYIGPDWQYACGENSIWSRVDNIPDEELWRAHERRRERLVTFSRKRLVSQYERRAAPQADVQAASEVLQSKALTIGFARRFATYKRGTLLLRNLDRLEKILSNSEHPVQIVMAGKAHPRDDAGKELIKEIQKQIWNRPALKGRFIFIEDYDMYVARRLVQGVDIWLNTPRRPLEASGTSGMKASANGVLNLSILDGWWCEAYERDPECGWAIGNGTEYSDTNYQDEIEANSIYDLLEREIVPLFYHRSADGLPREWIAKMKRSLRTINPIFSSARMVEEYTERAYIPVQEYYAGLQKNDFAGAKELSAWKQRVKGLWSGLKIDNIEATIPKEAAVGDKIPVEIAVNLNNLSPEEIQVELIYGSVDALGELISNKQQVVVPLKESKDGKAVYSGAICCNQAGRMGFSVRILPHNAKLREPLDMTLVLWA